MPHEHIGIDKAKILIEALPYINVLQVKRWLLNMVVMQ